MEMKEKLLANASVARTPTTPQYFIDRYNQVIDVYNASTNTPGFQLELLDDNPTFARISRIFSKPIVKILLVLFLAFAPLVNLIVLGMFIFYYLFLRRQGKKHRNNMRKVKNPMQSYYFLPEVCHQLGKHCTTLTIKTNQLEGFTFNNDLYQELKAKTNQSDTITVTIYDQYFYDSYHLFKKQQYKVAAWILLSTVLITADIIFYIALLDLY